MRYAIPLLALSVSAAAQEPAILVNPAAQTSQFGATALGGGTTEVAAIQFTFDPSVTAPTWFVSATVKNPSSTFYQPYSGTVTGTAGSYTVTPNTDYSLVPPPTTDYFAANVSSDLRMMVVDTGAATPVAVYVRNGTTGNFTPFGSVPAPVPVGYRDAMPGNTISSWNGTNGQYEFLFINGLDLAKTTLTLTAPGTVAVGPVVTIASSAIQKHSQSPLRQWTGIPTDWGTGRAMIYSQNDSSADSYFRSSLNDNSITPIAGTLIFDDPNWKANPGHIGGGRTIWAYAPVGYQDPMQEDICAMSSATVPSTGGPVTICAWHPSSTTPVVGIVMLGALQSPGINLGLPFISGKLGLNPAALVFLPGQPFDPVHGEITYNLVLGRLPRGRIDMQVLCFNLSTNRIFLGNNARLDIL